MISNFGVFTLVLGVGGPTVAALATAQAKDPFVGTWKHEPRQEQGQPRSAPKSSTSTYEAAGKGYKVSVKSEPASGPVPAVVLHLRLGRQRRTDHRQQPECRHGGREAYRRQHAGKIVNKKNGKVTTTQKNVVAADGKTRTVTTTGTDGQGQKVSNVAVYEKQ